jgi:uncharacterized protein involved in exopolysaccharide biosynthesis
LLICAAVIWQIKSQPAMYRAEALLEYAADPQPTGAAGTEEWYRTQDYLLSSRRNAEQVVAAERLHENRAFLGLFRGEVLRTTSSDAVRLFLQRLSVQRISRTRLVRVSVTDPDPALAARLANATVQAYLLRAQHFRDEASRQALAWLDQQIQAVTMKLRQIDGELHENAEIDDDSALPLDDQQLVVVEKVKQLEAELTRVRLRRIELAAHAAKLDGATRASPIEAHTSELDEDAEITQLRGEFAANMLRYEEASSNQGNTSLLAEQHRSKLDALREQLAVRVRGFSISAQAELAETMEIEHELQRELAKANKDGLQIQTVALERGRFDRERADTALMLNNLRNRAASLATASASFSGRLVEPAITPREPMHHALLSWF